MCDQKQFLSGLNKLGLSLTPQQTESILLYCQELRKWSKRINLIARHTSPTDIVEKHFLDSLTLVPVIQQYGFSLEQGRGGNNKISKISLLDIGTGAGFPGLVLATAQPQLSVTLVEPRQKRVSFLRHIIRTLGLSNVQVTDQRIEPGQGWDGTEFTFITSRAVAAADIFLPMIEEMTTAKTVVIMMNAGDEQQRMDQRVTGWQCLEERKFFLPFSQHPRTLTLLQKVG
ncbi:MAG: 16S rRNA (guanine(527)-N(7))-methyltransferase RsmG [Candidatus Electrothrix sp. AW1]|nr:16S rRNA (guanine(527)-N(7))-methyltransferase RsmG [Candidatus Electrothrix sp. AX1]MCI5182154.1 16S rRNA (guanine(527)-N(7))-methyltransferase RsmG [Candidatus Electrothrix gigas]